MALCRLKKYDIKVAFENSPYMQDTYRLNHPGVEVQGDVCAADYDKIKEKYGNIDVVIGGPPVKAFQMQIGRKIMQSAKIICWLSSICAQFLNWSQKHLLWKM